MTDVIVMMLTQVYMTNTGNFPCIVSSVIRVLNWSLMYGAFLLRVFRVWLQVHLSRLRKSGALILAEKNATKNSMATSKSGEHSIPGVTSIPKSATATGQVQSNHSADLRIDVNMSESHSPSMKRKSIAGPPSMPSSPTPLRAAAPDTLPRAPTKGSLSDEEILLEKIKLYEYWSDEARLLKIALLFALSVLILNMFISIPFNWYSDPYAGVCLGLGPCKSIRSF
jgi:hypothetical protein